MKKFKIGIIGFGLIGKKRFKNLGNEGELVAYSDLKESKNYFSSKLKNKVKFSVVKNLKNALASALKDIKLLQKTNNTILLSPGAASFDQYKNFENRGNEFKKLSKLYAKKFI